MDYNRTQNGAIQSVVDADGIEVIYQASNIRNERTGVHATVSIGFREKGRGAIPLDEDTYNVGRREERERLVNSIYKKSPIKAVLESSGYDSARMSMDLMLFQRGLWSFEIGSQEAERRGGTNERKYKQFVIEPFVVDGGGTIIFAPPGRGKSWLGMLFCVTVDAGVNTFWKVTQGPALFVNLERSAESVDVRLGDINEALDLPRERPLLRLDRRGRSLPDVIDGIQRTVEREGVKFVLVDSLSRMGYGNLIDNDPANKAMDALNSLSPAAWAVLAHTPRGDETHTFGSQMFDAAADITVQLMTDDKSKPGTLGIGLRVDKANDIRKDTAINQIALVFDNYGLNMIRRPEKNEFLEINQNMKTSVSEQIAQYVRNNGASDAGAIAESLNIDRTTVNKELKTQMYAQSGRDGRKVLYDLATTVHNEVWRNEDPHTLIANSHDSTPTHNNEVVGVQSNFNEEEGSVISPEYRESHFTLRYVKEEEGIF